MVFELKKTLCERNEPFCPLHIDKEMVALDHMVNKGHDVTMDDVNGKIS